jgi:hypothetical protein
MENREIGEIESVAKAIEESLKNNPNSEIKFKKLKIKEKEFVNIVVDFINNGITNQEIKNKMLSNLEKFKLFNGTGGEISFDEKKKELKMKAGVGRRQLMGGHVETDLKTIRGLAHELAHSITQKFNINRLNEFGNPHEKDQSIGEIESKFIEKCFNEYLEENADAISKRLNISTEELHEQIKALKIYDDIDLLHHIEELKKKNYNGRDCDYTNRYVVGEVVSRVVFERLKSNKEKRYDLFNDYTKKNADMNRDETAQFLSEGNMNSYGEVVGQFVSAYSPKIEKVSAETIELAGYQKSEKREIDFSQVKKLEAETKKAETKKNETSAKQKGE